MFGAFPITGTNPRCKDDVKLFNAAWDTGASRTVITNHVAQELQLELLTAPAEAIYGIGGRANVRKTYANFQLPFSDIFIDDLEIGVIQEIEDSFDVIIGFDIISRGVFTIRPTATHYIVTLDASRR